jgi:hypothetical protein
MEMELRAVGDGVTAVLPCGSVTLRWKRMASAGTMEVFTPDVSVALRCGMQLRLAVEGEEVFVGYIFTIERSHTGRVITARDSMRYLLCRDTKVYQQATAASIVQDICGERGLTLAGCEDNGMVIDSLIADRQTLLDMISGAIDQSVQLGGERLTLLDDAGELRLMRESNLDTGLVLNGENLLAAYVGSSDIDGDTYNRIQLVRKNRKTGSRQIFVQEDAASIAQLGVLQYTGSVLQNTPDGEIYQKLAALLEQKNRVVEGLTLEAVGDIRCRAGLLVGVELPEAGVDGQYRILTAEHRFRSGGYKMKLKCEKV